VFENKYITPYKKETTTIESINCLYLFFILLIYKT
jgi:hypothetical protein